MKFYIFQTILIISFIAFPQFIKADTTIEKTQKIITEIVDKSYPELKDANIEVKTSDSRAVLAPTVSLKSAITQWGNLGGLIAGLYTKDYELIGRSLNDVIVEPARKHLIPNFDTVKNAALQNGALGAGISGAGPSIFALCQGENNANAVAKSMSNAYADTGIPFDIHISKVNEEGTKII